MREVVESSLLKVFKRHVDVVLMHKALVVELAVLIKGWT